MTTRTLGRVAFCAVLAAGAQLSAALAQEPSANDGMAMSMTSAFGPYSMNREASGTSWQPDASPGMGEHAMNGAWMSMQHVTLNLVFDSQGGPRGDDMTFGSGMAMWMTQGPWAGGTLGFRAMISPDPLMGARGYPLLFQTGETADGTTPLIDRQHPHDLFMELAASYSRKIGQDGAVYFYAGLPGEPAFGPPAFMHRQAGMDLPEAPLSHHWLDSTHVTFGVLTAGVSNGPVKVELSSFRGREPDEHRYDIESSSLDSWSTRVSWNPTRRLALQASYADVHSPEALDPDEDETKASASLLYSADWGAATLAWGSKKHTAGSWTDAFVAEASYWPSAAWTLFGRGELVEESELVAGPAIYRVGKLSVGAVRDFQATSRVKLGVGGLVSVYSIPDGLKGLYGSPTSGMAFLRLKAD